MKNACRLFAGILLTGAMSCLAADELALRLQPALDAITPDGLLAHIKILASDEFEGRAPGTKGEELSVKYISDQFKQIGLKPGNPDGSYVQEVPLAGIKSEPRMSFTVGDKTTELNIPTISLRHRHVFNQRSRSTTRTWSLSAMASSRRSTDGTITRMPMYGGKRF